MAHGVRKGCVLSPVLFAAVLESAMRTWRAQVGDVGWDIVPSAQRLCELRFADDILLLARSAAEVAQMLDALVVELATAGLVLNPGKTMVLTTVAGPPPQLQTPAGLTLRVLPPEEAHKWLGRKLCFSPEHRTMEETTMRIRAGMGAFWARSSLFCHRGAPVSLRMRLFHATVTQIVCYAAGTKALPTAEARALDASYRKCLRKMAGLPAACDWRRPWHQILHDANARAELLAQTAGVRAWSDECAARMWRRAGKVARMPADRWARALLDWDPSAGLRRRNGHWVAPAGRAALLREAPCLARRAGRPHLKWQDAISLFWAVLGEQQRWQDVACDVTRWEQLEPLFLTSRHRN